MSGSCTTESTCGTIRTAAAPCRIRAVISMSGLQAVPTSTEATRKMLTPAESHCKSFAPRLTIELPRDMLRNLLDQRMGVIDLGPANAARCGRLALGVCPPTRVRGG